MQQDGLGLGQPDVPGCDPDAVARPVVGDPGLEGARPEVELAWVHAPRRPGAKGRMLGVGGGAGVHAVLGQARDRGVAGSAERVGGRTA